VRHEGVDEDDFVKISANHIFVSAGNKINVLDRKTKKHLGALTTDTFNSTLFLKNNKLIVLEAESLSLFEITGNSLPRLLVKREIKGWQHVESRLVDNHLIMISSDDIRSERSQESTERKIDPTKIDCMQTFQPAARVSDVGTGTVGLRMNRSGFFSGSNVTRLESYSLNDLDSRSMYFLDTHRLYMTPKNIYLFGTVADSGVGLAPERVLPKEKTHLRKIPLLANGSFGEPVSGFIPGRIKDVWALNELSGGEVAVATSSGNLWDGSALNHFQILSEKSNSLETIGRTEDYGAKEDIRSVRFVNNIAYVVTFKKTDPLFAIDVSKPEEPKILGELKIPGFSTYMHPLNSERLVGLGFDATEVGDVAYYQGLQLSLFDVSQPEEMNRKDVKIFGSRGSNSLATNDHKAFFLDTAAQWVGFPVTLFQGCGGEMVCTPKPTMPFLPEVLSSSVVTGALLVRVRNDAFEEPLLISHDDLLGSECAGSNPWGAWWSSPSGTNDIERILKVDGELLTLSRGALKTFRISDRLEVLQSTRWSDNCNQPIPEPVPL
jgi:inhibitor of cysteine peptidase